MGQKKESKEPWVVTPDAAVLMILEFVEDVDSDTLQGMLRLMHPDEDIFVRDEVRDDQVQNTRDEKAQ
jgi:hypothetical protein